MSLNNTTSSGVTIVLPLPWSVVVAFLMMVLVVWTVLGNILVFAAFIVTRKLQSFSNYLVLNLAIADVLVGIVSTPFYSQDVLLGGWHLGREACMWWMTTDWIACASSSFSLCVISLDRFTHIAYPFWAKRYKTKFLLALYMSLPWAIAALAFVPLTLFWEQLTGTTLVRESECNVPYYNSYWLLMFNLGITILLPFGMTAVLNIMLYLTIRRRLKSFASMCADQDHRSISTSVPVVSHVSANTRCVLASRWEFLRVSCLPPRAGNNSNHHDLTIATSQSSMVSEESQRTGYQTHRKHFRKARSLFIFVFVFGICWVPFVIAVYVRACCVECRTQEFYKYEVFATFLVLSNSAFNPVLYTLLQPRLRNGFKQIMKLILRRGTV